MRQRVAHALEHVPEAGSVAAEPNDLEARVVELAAQRVALVPAIVADELVGRTEVIGVGGDAQQQPTVGPDVVVPLLQRELVVGDVLEHFERAGDVEVVVVDGIEARIDRAAPVGRYARRGRGP